MGRLAKVWILIILKEIDGKTIKCSKKCFTIGKILDYTPDKQEKPGI